MDVPRRSTQQSDTDEDADLRSLLSGNSLGGSWPRVNNPRRQSRAESQQASSTQQQQRSTQEFDTDEDDELRSLLSGNSIRDPWPRVNNPRRQVRAEPQQQQALSNQQASEDSHSASPSPPNEENINNITIMNANDMNNTHRAYQHNPNAGSKRVLWVLGTVILATALLGPSGILWDIMEVEDINPNLDYSRGMRSVHHGDKHHHISPPMDNDVFQGERMEYSHPMIQSEHPQFGQSRKARKDRRKNKKRAKAGGLGIKEAIDNIDKVFLENRPVAAYTMVKKKGGRQYGNLGGGEYDETLPSDASTANEIPVVHADDDTLPKNAEELDNYKYALPASDALECRASVKAFVINATDVRDECDGLRKAFDKTCSVQNPVSAGGGAAPPPAVVNPAAGAGLQRQRDRRRLSERGQPHLWNLIPAAFRRELNEAGVKVTSHLQRRLGGHSRADMHHRMLKRSNRTLQESSEHDGGQRKTEVFEEEEAQPVQQQQPKQEQAPPLVSLNIPTADKHISDEMLDGALLLQTSSDPKPMKAPATSVDAQVQEQQPGRQMDDSPQVAVPPPVTAVAKPNITAQSAEAAQDAAESAEAIRTAVEGVKNVMNDPKSVEARTCCASILSVFHEHCDPTTTGVEDYSDRRLLVVVFVITVCGMVKSVIRHLNIRWLPEAGGCILVGVFGYLILEHMPHVQFAFDGDMFLRIMVPPIVFEAAVKINKQSFRRHVVPITIFAIVGTLASTAFTAFLLHKGSASTSLVTTIPARESLIFGALISSIDPIAVLSVLNNLGMTDSDTIYVLIFGESLLNDGVAIVLFQTLVHFLDETLVIDGDVVIDGLIHFVVVALGSVTVGALSGACSTVYFAMMHGCQTPMVEVIMFCCWSFIPYYICDMVEWSGIVAIVANGFVMDLYVIGQKQEHPSPETIEDEIGFLLNGSNNTDHVNSTSRVRNNRQNCPRIFNYEGHLSQNAENHIHFVIEIFATLMETAIFAYLGLFLFSPRYHWSMYLTLLSVFATVMGRVIMIPLLSHVANLFNRMNLSRNRSGTSPNNEGVHIDKRMQLVLVFAGLRGAMSFALVEHIPMFDTTTGQGSRFKPELKAMTSASVIFTVFVLGGATSYLMERLGYSISKQHETEAIEIAPLLSHEKDSPAMDRRSGPNRRSNGSVRHRGPR